MELVAILRFYSQIKDGANWPPQHGMMPILSNLLKPDYKKQHNEIIIIDQFLTMPLFVSFLIHHHSIRSM